MKSSPHVQPAIHCVLLLALILVPSLVAGGCGDDPSGEHSIPGPGNGSPGRKAARLAQDIDARRKAIQRIESSGLHETILNAVQAHHQTKGKWTRALFPDWTWTNSEILSYLALNRTGVWDSLTAPAGQYPEDTGPALEVIKYYAEQLAAHGVDLLLVPVPKRLQVYPDRLLGIDDLGDFLGVDLGYEQALLELAEAGVEVLDLLPAFLAARFDRSGETDELLFLDHNPHWTPRGVTIAADAIAARVRELPWFEQGPARLGVDFETKQERILFETRVPDSRDMRQQSIWMNRVLNDRGKPAAVNDRESHILWLGDSFTAWYHRESGDIMRLVYARLGHRFDKIFGDGSGMDALWETIRRRQDALEGKRLVIWLFSSGRMAGMRHKKIDLFGGDEPR